MKPLVRFPLGALPFFLVLATIPVPPGATLLSPSEAKGVDRTQPYLEVEFLHDFDTYIPPTVILWLHNPTANTVTLASADFEERLFYLADDAIEPVYFASFQENSPLPLTVPPYSTAKVIGPIGIWIQRLQDGSAAESGDYRLEFSMRASPVGGFGDFYLAPSGTTRSETTSPFTKELSGFTSEAPADDGDNAVDIATSSTYQAGYGFTYPRWYEWPHDWNYNNQKAPISGLEWAVKPSFDKWEDDSASWVDFNYVDLTLNEPFNADGQNVVGWCYSCVRDGSLGGTKNYTDPFDSNRMVEVDIALNASLQWSSADDCVVGKFDLASVMTHEIGHWLGLDNIFNPGDDGYVSWMGDNNRAFTMYGIDRSDEGDCSHRTPEWGDHAGMRYAYPNTYTMPNFIGNENAGVGAEMGDIDGGGQLHDVVIAWVEDPEGHNLIGYVVGWDVSASSGAVGTWSGTRWPAQNIGHQTAGLGAALGNVDGTAEPELFLAWADNPGGANFVYYKIGWNIDATGAASSWSGNQQMPGGGIGDETQGVGACLRDFTGNGLPELVIGWVDNPLLGNSLKYRVGFDLDSGGSASSWSGTKTVGGGEIGFETQGLGVTCPDVDMNNSPDLVFAWVDNPGGENRIHYRLGMNPGSDVELPGSSWVQREGFANNVIGTETQGLGLAFGVINSPANAEWVFAWADNPQGSNHVAYREEWDIRWNSHP